MARGLLSNKKEKLSLFDPRRTLGSGTPTRVRIRFNARNAAYIEEVCWHASQIITPDPAHVGSIIFEVNVSHPEEVIWWMRQWGSDAEVLEPQAMRDYMLTMTQAEAAMYRQSV